MPAELLQFLMPILAGVASFYGSHVAVKTHLEYLRRDVDFAHRRIDAIQK